MSAETLFKAKGFRKIFSVDNMHFTDENLAAAKHKEMIAFSHHYDLSPPKTYESFALELEDGTLIILGKVIHLEPVR